MNGFTLQFLMLVFAGWVNRYQQDVIEYLQEENRALREQLGGKRLRFTDRRRRRWLAVKAKAIGRKRLFEIGTVVTPGTLFRWHRELVAKEYDAAASHDILERARCNNNAPELVSPTHTPHRAARSFLFCGRNGYSTSVAGRPEAASICVNLQSSTHLPILN